MNKEDFCDAFCSKLYMAQVPIGYVLRTPFFKEDGDPISIYIRRNERNPKQFRLEDDGQTIAYLEASGVDFDSESRMNALARMLKQYEVELDESDSLLHTNFMADSEVATKAVAFVGLMNRVWDLCLLSKQQVRGTFKDDLIDLVEAQFAGAKIRFDEPLLASMRDYIVDIIVEDLTGKKLAIFAGNSELKALEALLFAKEQKDQKITDARAMLILPSAKPKEIKDRTLSRVMNSEIILAAMDGDAIAVRKKMQDTLIH